MIFKQLPKFSRKKIERKVNDDEENVWTLITCILHSIQAIE